MLSEKNRLKNKKDFDRVFKKGKGFREDFLFLKHASNQLANSRLGIVVSQKISKKAVLRNRIKRRIRAVVSRKLPKIKKGTDFILVAIPGLEKKDFREIETALTNVLKKSKLISN
jgi:ribonuclease P protein component